MGRYVWLDAEGGRLAQAGAGPPALLLDEQAITSEYASGNKEPLYALAAVLWPACFGRHVESVSRLRSLDPSHPNMYVLEMRPSGQTYVLEPGFVYEQACILEKRGLKCQLLKDAEARPASLE